MLSLGRQVDDSFLYVAAIQAGKSTLLKLMFGELSPTEGEVRKHTHLRIAKYHQHSTDQVRIRGHGLAGALACVMDSETDRGGDRGWGGQLNLDQTPLEYMASCFPEKKLEIEVSPSALNVGRLGGKIRARGYY